MFARLVKSAGNCVLQSVADQTLCSVQRGFASPAFAEPFSQQINVQAVNLPPSVLPNVHILDKIVQKPGQRTRFSDRLRKFKQIVAEIDFLYSISTEVPASLTDQQWVQLLDTVSAAEREHLLRTIHYAQLVETAERQKQMEATTTECQNPQNGGTDGDGEGCFDGMASSSASAATPMYRLFGDDYCDETALKGRIDARYGVALCRNFGLEPADRMPNVLVDCRFMYAHKAAHIVSAAKRVNQLHMANWTSSAPFPVSIVNFFADETVNRTVRSQWHFLYGTPSEQQQQAEEGCHKFSPHPFAPKVTTRGVTEICADNGITKDQIAYVSQRAVDYLPDNLCQFRAFVLLPFDDWEQRWLLPTKAALAEQLPCYRLPLDQHICDVSRNIPCWLVANILREVYTGRMTWPMVARRWGRELTRLAYRPNSDQIDPEQLPFPAELYMEKRKMRAQIMEKLEQYSDMLLNERRPPTPRTERQQQKQKTAAENAVFGRQGGEQPQMNIRHARRVGLTPALVGSVKQRKYSREERNRRRMEEAKKKAEEEQQQLQLQNDEQRRG